MERAVRSFLLSHSPQILRETPFSFRFLLFVTFAFATAASAYQVTATSERTVLDRTHGGIDYGDYGYRYAPSIIRRGTGNQDAWFCVGVARADNPFEARDHVAYVQDWGTPQVVLCPVDENSRTFNPNCSGQHPAGPDYNGVCDPTVVNVGGQYWMYYTADPASGSDAQMFLARSNDGIHWTKYPSSSQPAQPVIAFPDGPGQTGKYGVGEGSVVYKDGNFWLFHTYFPYFSDNSIYLSKSNNGINFTRYERLFAEAGIPFGNEGTGGVDVKYIPGWNVWLMVHPTFDKQNLTWNISRDGQHWLPWSGAFGYQTRIIPISRQFATAPALEGNDYGWIGNGTLAPSQQTSVAYAAGDCPTVAGCFWDWTLDAQDLTFTPEALTGYLDTVDANRFAIGWTYDRDTGVNDAAANGGSSGPLGHETWVRPVAFSTATGIRYEGLWQSASGYRGDLVSAGVVPDPYHGFAIDLKTQAFPTGTYRVRVEGGEFPTGMGARELAGEFIVSLLPKADFNGDGKADILTRHSSGDISLWTMNGPVITSANFVGSPGGSYTIAGVADFDGNGKADVLLRDSLGGLGMWLMNGSTIVSGHFVGSPGTSYTVAGVGDFSGDGKADVLLRHALGDIGMWIMNGPVIVSGHFVESPGADYSVAGVADFDGDAKADVLLRDSGGGLGMWIMNGPNIASGGFVGSPGGSFAVASVADFGGDGKADILLQDSAGAVNMWTMNGPTVVASAVVGSASGYTIPVTNDYSGDGKADILLRHSSSGDLGMWLMNGSTISSGAFVGSPGTDYTFY